MLGFPFANMFIQSVRRLEAVDSVPSIGHTIL